LIIAAQKNNYDMLMLFMTKGADPFISNRSGNSALDYAKMNENQQMVNYLQRTLDAY